MAENITVSAIIPARAERVFSAWLDPAEHAKMTGGAATDEGAGAFSAWDGYITGRTLSSAPHQKIVQAWRTTEFPDGAPDSKLTVLLDPATGGTRLTLVHENLPDGQGDAYEQGWQEHYFAPMQAHFSSAGEKVREVGEKLGDAFEEVAEDAKQAVQKARASAQKQGRKVVREVKRVEKKMAAQVKKLGKKMKALVSKKPGKKAAPKKATAKKAAPKKATAKKAAPKKAAPKKATAKKAAPKRSAAKKSATKKPARR